MNLKKHVCVSLACTMASGSLVLTGALPAYATEADRVEYSNDGSTITFGNDSIERVFSLEDGAIRTSSIINKKIGRTMQPDEGSEDFIISTLNEGLPEDLPSDIDNSPVYLNPEAIERSGWSYSVTNSEGTALSASEIAKVFDGDLDTHADDYRNAGEPFTLDIDLGSVQEVGAFTYDKRPGYTNEIYGINGTMGAFEVYSSEDGESYEKIGQGEFRPADYNLHKVGDLFNVGDRVWYNFDEPVSTRYIRIVQTSCAFNQDKHEFSAAEINLYPSAYNSVVQETLPEDALDRSGWTGTITNKDGSDFGSGPFNSLIDGDLSTYVDEYRKAGFPINVDFDLGSEQTVRSLSLDKRPGYSDAAYGINGTTGRFHVYTSDDGESWSLNTTAQIPASAWNLHDEGNLHNVGDRVYVNLQHSVTSRYIRFQALSDGLGTTEEFSLSEINLYSDEYSGPDYRTSEVPQAVKTIASSDLSFERAECTDTETGKKLTITYAPYTYGQTTWSIAEVFVLDEGKDYMRSFLELSNDQPEKTRIDYIEQDAFSIAVADQETEWTHAAPNFSTQDISAYMLTLGQPVYVSGFYMGSEFPAADSTIKDHDIHIRYYSGKNFEELERDNQLTTDGKFVSWQNVVGAARGISEAEVQSDFFEYIEDIATPTEFRRQYNSWYDNMLNITDASIEKSFLEVEKGLARAGVDPLDSYVMDDGWNAYYDGTYLSSPNSQTGKTANSTGFWEINDKFPNDFFTASELANRLQSTFGVWIGPRGGYNFPGQFANYLQASGTGYSQGGSICVASRKYVKNFEQLAKDWQSEYGVTYWKWDGFNRGICTNSDHDHMTGGENNMYSFSDQFEAWLDLFENVCELNRLNGRNLFINATCYVQLSPWLLQWVNTVWLQESADTAQAGSGERHEQKIYYRNNVYYKLFKTLDLQFPLNHLYNHEPIYGISDNIGSAQGSVATDETWREYMLANAMRGTAFWELYYSPSIMTEEKYEITADALEWAEENHHILKTVKYHGGSSVNNVHGFSGWDGSEGIISFTNPNDTAAQYDLLIDAQIGATPDGVVNLSGIQVEPFVAGTLEETISYGDTLHVSLEPHETKIYQFGKKQAGAPEIIYASGLDDHTIELRFDRRISPVSITANGKEGTCTLKPDYHTISVSIPDASVSDMEIAYVIEDETGAAFEGRQMVSASNSGLILDAACDGVLDTDTFSYDAESDILMAEDLNGPTVLKTDRSLEGIGPFTIETAVQTTDAGKKLFGYGDEIVLGIDQDGFMTFTVNGITATSKESHTIVTSKATGVFNTDAYEPHQTETELTGFVSDGKPHKITVMKEANGMLKVYLDDALTGTAWDTGLKPWSPSKQDMVMSDEGFTGSIMPVRIYPKALSTEELVSPSHGEDPSIIMMDRSGWSPSACSESGRTSGDVGAWGAIDGTTTNRWHTDYDNGTDSHGTGNHWIRFDFDRPADIDTVWYQGRGSSNGSFKDYRLEVFDADGNTVKTVTGTFSDSTALQPIPLGEAVEAGGFKLTGINTINGANFGAAVNIEASITAEAMSEEALNAAKDALNASLSGIDLDHVTHKSKQAYTSALAKAKSAKATYTVLWDSLAQSVRDAADALVNTAGLDEAIALADAIKAGKPADDQDAWNAFLEAYDLALDQKNNGTAAGVAKAAADLKQAMDALDPKQPDKADKEALKDALDQARDLLKSDDYASLEKDDLEAFEKALAGAQSVYEDESADQNSVDQAKEALNQAMKDLEEKAKEAAISILEAALEKADAIDLDQYEDDQAKDAFMKVKEDAQNSRDDQSLTPAGLRGLAADLEKAIRGLNQKQENPEKPDTSQLEDLIADLEKIDLDQFADNEAMEEFRTALENARTAAADPDSQESVNQAKNDLAAAFNALEKGCTSTQKEALNAFVKTVEELKTERLSEDEIRILEDLKTLAEKTASDKAATETEAESVLETVRSDEIQDLIRKANQADPEIPDPDHISIIEKFISDVEAIQYPEALDESEKMILNDLNAEARKLLDLDRPGKEQVADLADRIGHPSIQALLKKADTRPETPPEEDSKATEEQKKALESFIKGAKDWKLEQLNDSEAGKLKTLKEQVEKALSNPSLTFEQARALIDQTQESSIKALIQKALEKDPGSPADPSKPDTPGSDDNQTGSDTSKPSVPSKPAKTGVRTIWSAISLTAAAAAALLMKKKRH